VILNQNEKIILASIIINIILVIALVGVGVTYPQAPPREVVVYRGWWIYPPSQNSTRSAWTAVHTGYSPISDVDLQSVIYGIDKVTK